jgi:exodeoxyribonuclease VII large subunit
MPSEPVHVYSVSDITFLVKDALERAIPPVWVAGEISNFIHHRSGHMYFTLKDERSQLRSVMFRSSNAGLTFTPADGMKVVALGAVTVYEAGGVYQLQVREMQPLGVGELQKAFEELKKKLREEGLFDEKKKKDIPRFPESIGVITSPSGAAIRDIIRVLARRMPSIDVVVRPVLVQGSQAAEDIAEAIGEMDAAGFVDVIIVGRGGGSIEDLWPFNQEAVARAIFDCATPVISAVGHEVDFTIADFVADLRAPTPSAAAELASPSRDELLNRIEKIRMSLGRDILRAHSDMLSHLSNLVKSYGFRRPVQSVREMTQRRDELERRLLTSAQVVLNMLTARLEHCVAKLAGFSPKSLLGRGYAFVQAYPQAKTVRSVDDISAGDGIRMTFSDGTADATVDRVFKDSGGRRDG